MGYNNGPSGRNRGSTARAIQVYAPGSPALGTATAVHAAVATAAGSTVTTAITNPDVPRNVTATPGGTTGNVLAVSVIVNGTDVNGAALTETLPAFSAGAGTAVTGVKAFRTVTSVVFPIVGASTTVSIGTGAKLGMPYPMALNTIWAAFFGGTKEATAPTMSNSATVAALTTTTLNSALNGSAVVIYYLES